jgi:DNA-binding NarL/FixJ family response regulator
MVTYLETRGPSGSGLFPLEGERASVGASTANDVVVAGDSTVSHVHAVLECIAGEWTVRDVGSRNGTFVNGERILGERILRHGDELRVGETRFLYRTERGAGGAATATRAAQRPPELTRRERDVLLALCQPVFSGSYLTEPASVREIATKLVLTESAVKKHLINLYGKFGLNTEGERRRAQLANEAIRRGAVTLADLRAQSEPVQ